MTPRSLALLVLFCFTHVVSIWDIGLGFQEPNRTDQSASLTDESFATWRDRIRATKSELEWQDLPWVTSYHKGIRLAAAENKPLLLWVMNGHPLGCT